MKAQRITTAVLAVALLMAACGGDGGTSVANLRPGDCFDDQPALEIETVELLDCSEPHDLEVYHVGSLGLAGAYPGEEALIEAGFEICEGPLFDAYVGRSYLESELYTDFYRPTAEGWADGDDELVCLIFDLDGTKLTGSMRGSGR